MSAGTVAKPVKVDESTEPGTTPQAYVATGTGFWLGFWKPGQILSMDVPTSFHEQVSLQKSDYKSLIVVCVTALALRLWNLPNPPDIVGEERSILKRINQISRSEFFFESSPPLANWFWYILARVFGGYTGGLNLEEDGSYIGHTFPFRELRVVSAVLGVALVACAFLTLKLTGASRRSATMGAIFVAFECSYALHQHYITRHSLTLALLGFTVYLWKALELQQPLTRAWHGIALLLGLTLGTLVASSSQGWWTIYWILSASAYQIWWSFGDRRQKQYIRKFIINALARLVYFLAVPLALETLVISFQVQSLTAVGEGSPYVSGPFQKSFSNAPVTRVPAPVGYGSVVSIKHFATNAYLHSLNKNYDGGSDQQVVTGFQFPDINNYWFIEKEFQKTSVESPFEQIQDGDIIRLRHFQTLRRLHSHDFRPPLSDKDYQFEVSAYGAEGYKGNPDDIWRVDIINNGTLGPLKALGTQFKLYHLKQRCYLFSSREQLPHYGASQQIVSCCKGCFDEKTIWYIEDNSHKMHDDAPMADYDDISIASKVMELRNLMKVPEIASDQSKRSNVGVFLPFLPQGTPLFEKNHRQVLLIGNAMVWYVSILSIAVYFTFKISTFVARQRAWVDFTTFRGIREMDHHVGSLCLLWGCHFIPCILRENNELTDYLPALYGSILAATRWLDYFSALVLRKSKLVNAFHALCIAGALSTFVFYSPFIYGEKMLRQQCYILDLGIWSLNCRGYFYTEQEYVDYDKTIQGLDYYFKPAPIEEWAWPTAPEVTALARPVPELRLDSPLLVDDPRFKDFKLKYEANLASTEGKGDELDLAFVSKVVSEWAKITDTPQNKNA